MAPLLRGGRGSTIAPPRDGRPARAARNTRTPRRGRNPQASARGLLGRRRRSFGDAAVATPPQSRRRRGRNAAAVATTPSQDACGVHTRIASDDPRSQGTPRRSKKLLLVHLPKAGGNTVIDYLVHLIGESQYPHLGKPGERHTKVRSARDASFVLLAEFERLTPDLRQKYPRPRQISTSWPRRRRDPPPRNTSTE